MAILTGPLMYLGSFKSIRNYRNLYDSRTFAGEKGGANRDLILNNPAFVRTRENMSEFGGCGAAVKAIRRGLQNLLPEHADAHLTGRLMRMAKQVNCLDLTGGRGRRAIIFSANREILLDIIFNDRMNLSEMIQTRYGCCHPDSRAEATLSVTDLTISQVYVPAGATFFRVQNHLSIISDWAFSPDSRRYEPVSPLSGMSAFACSDYSPVNVALSFDAVTAFPLDIVLTADCSVMQCIGVEFFIKSYGNVYLPLKGGTMKVVGVF